MIRSSSASDNSSVLAAASVTEPKFMSCPAEAGCSVTVAVAVSVPLKSIRLAVICAPPPPTFAPLATVNLAAAPNSVTLMLKPGPPSKSLAADVLDTRISPAKASRPGLPLGLLTPATPFTSPTVNPSTSSNPTWPTVVRMATVSTSLLLLDKPTVPPACTARLEMVIAADCVTPAPLIRCSVLVPAGLIGALIVIAPALLPPIRRTPAKIRSSSASESSSVLAATSVVEPRSTPQPVDAAFSCTDPTVACTEPARFIRSACRIELGPLTILPATRLRFDPLPSEFK